jgi:hypothetical protein
MALRMATVAVGAVLALALAAGRVAATPYERAECQRYKSCNGEMCADICEIGTVVLDEWATGAQPSHGPVWCACACECVRGGERERERDGERGREKNKQAHEHTVFVLVCVCARACVSACEWACRWVRNH